MNSEELFVVLIDVTSEDIKLHGCAGGVMYAAGWALSPNQFILNVKKWLVNDGFETVGHEKIFEWESFKRSSDYFEDGPWKEMLAEIGEQQFELWFGDVHVYEHNEH